MKIFSFIKTILMSAEESVKTIHTHYTYPGTAAQNKQHSAARNTAKLDRETEELHHDKVGLDVGKLIQQGRQQKNLTQKELATVSIKYGCGVYLTGFLLLLHLDLYIYVYVCVCVYINFLFSEN